VIRHSATWIDPAYRQGRNIPPTLEAVGVVVPAHNQADTVAQCILSIFAANSRTGWRNSLWIVVVADACRDRTAKIARAAVGAFGEVLEVAVQSRGMARLIGTGAVWEHFYQKPRHAVLLADADADSCVPREWIDIQLKRQKADVGSIVQPARTAAKGAVAH
jgi:glycosyltransferase involved in cell wall biosynthesis